MKEKIFHLGVKALIQNNRGKFLILNVNQEKFKNPKPQGYWDLPGGRVMDDETIEETLFRELEEETGITTLNSFKPLDTIVSNIEIPLKDDFKAGLILTIYACTLHKSGPIILSSEHTDFAWASLTDTTDLMSHKYPVEFTDKMKNLTL